MSVQNVMLTYPLLLEVPGGRLSASPALAVHQQRAAGQQILGGRLQLSRYSWIKHSREDDTWLLKVHQSLVVPLCHPVHALGLEQFSGHPLSAGALLNSSHLVRLELWESKLLLYFVTEMNTTFDYINRIRVVPCRTQH